MKKLLPLLILALTTFVSSQSNQPFKAPKDFTIKYDKFEDSTDVSFNDIGLAGPYTVFGFTIKGSTVSENIDKFYLYFAGRNCRGFCFNEPDLIFLIDGERLRIDHGSNRLSDSAFFYLTRDELERFAKAKLIEFKIGPYQGAWKEKNIGKIQTLLDLGTKK